MRKIERTWFILLAFSLFLSQSFNVAAKETTGKVTLIIGQARLYTGVDKSPDVIQASLSNPQAWSRLSVKAELKAGSVISVAEKGRLDIIFQNERLRLDGPTLFQINAISETQETRSYLYFFKRQETQRVSKFKLFFGQVVAQVKKLGKKDVHDLETPTAVMGVYGTSYRVRASSTGKGDLAVVSGIVRIAFHQEGGKLYSVVAGNQLRFLTSRGEAVEIKPLPAAIQQKLQKIMEQIQETPLDTGGEIKGPEEGAPKEEFIEEELPEEGDTGPTNDDKGMGQGQGQDDKGGDFHNADNLNYSGGSVGSGHGVDNSQTPAGALERKKIDVKIRLDWSNLGD